MKTLVINWHLTERCNFKCGYCYSKWDENQQEVDIFKNEQNAIQILNELERLFNHFKQAGTFQQLRINFAGGEPFVYKKPFYRTLKLAKEKGFQTSIITNGSFINEDFITNIGPYIDLLGISIDSVNPDTNLKIGRHCKGKLLDLEQLSQHLQQLRILNKNIEIKVNTVVNEYNWQEDLSSMLTLIKPDRWKVFKVLPSISHALTISQQQFQTFVQHHSMYQQIMNVEDNELMQGSYLMISPKGKFYQNRPNKEGYDYSPEILEVGGIKAFQSIDFDIQKFKSRYQSIPITVIN